MKTLIIIGAGGHGRVVADSAEATQQYNNIIFLDDSYPQRHKNLRWDIIGTSDIFEQFIESAEFIVAFGNNRLRQKIIKQLKLKNAKICNVIHPCAYVSPNITLGIGIVVFANAVINVGSTISDGCIVNTGATIDHDCIVHESVHISPGAHIAGSVIVGEQSWIGIGASVIEGITIETNTQIAAGASVTKSTQPNALYAGVPATFKKSLKPL